MFESLSNRLSSALRSLGGQKNLTEENISSGLREVRLALLEADVNFKVVKDFTDRIREKCVGQTLLKGVSPAQQVIKIVHDELTELLGAEAAPLNLSGPKPAVVMLVGLQGSGKTTSAAKIANFLRKKGERPYLVPADTYRPAAIDQLKSLANQLDIPVYPSTTEMTPEEIAKNAIIAAKEANATVILLDTAGRLQINEPLMEELDRLKKIANPSEILFVADALTGQEAVDIAEAFNNRLKLGGVVLTKMDGDARGGAALSIKAVTGAQIKFVGMGEKLSELEVFHPQRMAGRILGMGDVLTLVEKAQEEFDADEMANLERKMRKQNFDLEDFRTQMRRVKKIGSFESIIKMIPGLGNIGEKLAAANNIMPEKELARTEAIINSMTMQERRNPGILNGSRRARIAKGAGVTVAQVNQLVKQFEQMRKMMASMLGGGKKLALPKRLSPSNMPGINRSGMGLPGMGLPGMDFAGMPQASGRPKSSYTKKSGSKRKKKK